MPALAIRPVKKGDFERIFPMLEQLWDYKKLNVEKLRKSFLISLADKNCRAFIAQRGSRALGYAGTVIINNLWQADKMCHLSELVVDKTARCKGIGSKLLKTVEAYAKLKRCSGVDLESAFRRKRTHIFYKKKGYESRAFFFTKLFKSETS